MRPAKSKSEDIMTKNKKSPNAWANTVPGFCRFERASLEIAQIAVLRSNRTKQLVETDLLMALEIVAGRIPGGRQVSRRER